MTGWGITKISDFMSERSGRYKPNSPVISKLKRINKIDFSGNFHITEKPSNTNMILIMPGDFVLSGINVTKGALGIYEGHENVVATIHYSSYIFDEKKVNIEYFKHFLKSPIFIQLLKEKTKGGIKTEIKAKHLLSLEIPLPSKDKQLEILNKFQKIEANNKELKSELLKQKALLKKLRQQILQEAVEGKVTAHWRATNPHTKSASELLEQAIPQKKHATKNNSPKKTPQLASDQNNPFKLPPEWAWCKLEDIIYGEPRNGYSPKAVNFATNVKTLKLGATTKGFFDPIEFKYVDEKISPDSHLWLQKGDLLIQRSNSLEHVGVSAIYDGEPHTFIYPDLMIKVQIIKGIEPAFIHKVLSSPFCREYYKKNAKGVQKSMPKINQKIVAQTLIPIAPYYEQRIILEHLERFSTLLYQLEIKIHQNQESVERLMQATLREAFNNHSMLMNS